MTKDLDSDFVHLIGAALLVEELRVKEALAERAERKIVDTWGELYPGQTKEKFAILRNLIANERCSCGWEGDPGTPCLRCRIVDEVLK